MIYNFDKNKQDFDFVNANITEVVTTYINFLLAFKFVFVSCLT